MVIPVHTLIAFEKPIGFSNVSFTFLISGISTFQSIGRMYYFVALFGSSRLYVSGTPPPYILYRYIS